MATPFLDAAARIAARLAAEAAWEGERCTWTVMRPDPDRFGEAIPVAAGGSVYQGTAGIALFLAEAYRRTGDREVGRAARGGMLHALARADELAAAPWGFHSGWTGVAWCGVRAGEALGDGALAEDALGLLARAEGREGEDFALDAVAGGAGAIPALLQLAPRLGRERAVGMAVRLGERLAGAARREPGGWSWGGSPWALRNLTGLAHGASGFALAFLELWRATGEGRWRYAAEQAIAYERQFFDPAEGSWPDFRWGALSQAAQEMSRDELRAALLAGDIPPYERRSMVAWCHGAAGIGMVRLRGWELAGVRLWREEAEAALRATVASLDQQRGWSLCHGAAGNGDFLLQAAEVLGDAQLRAPAEEAALREMEEVEARGGRWTSGAVGGVPDPSLMVGEAGTGWFLLRLDDPATPTPLLLRPDWYDGTTVADDASYAEIRDADVARWLGEGMKIHARIAGPAEALLPDPVEAAESGLSTPALVERAVRARIAGEADAELRERLDDAFAPELLAMELAAGVADMTEPYRQQLTGIQRAEYADDLPVVLSPKVRIAHLRREWDAQGEEQGPRDRFRLVYLAGSEVRTLPMTALAALVLESAREPGTAEEIAVRVAAALDDAADPAALLPRVREQLRHAWSVGVVDPAGALVTGG